MEKRKAAFQVNKAHVQIQIIRPGSEHKKIVQTSGQKDEKEREKWIPIFAKDAMGEFGRGRSQRKGVETVAVKNTESADIGGRVEGNSVENHQCEKPFQEIASDSHFPPIFFSPFSRFFGTLCSQRGFVPTHGARAGMYNYKKPNGCRAQ